MISSRPFPLQMPEPSGWSQSHAPLQRRAGHICVPDFWAGLQYRARIFYPLRIQDPVQPEHLSPSAHECVRQSLTLSQRLPRMALYIR